MISRSVFRSAPFLTAVVSLGWSAAAFAQEAAGAAAEVHKKNFLEVLAEGGWVMFPLLGFSIAMIWLIIDCAQRSSVKRLAPPEDLEELQNFFRAGDYVGAYQATLEKNSCVNNVVRAGLINVGDGKNATEEGMRTALGHEHTRIMTRISYLSVIGVCTPMVGLVGTVTGMIRAFGALGQGGATQNTAELSAAIGEVLVATASGLVIAIPAFMAFYFLRNRLIGAMSAVEEEIGHLFRKFPYHLAEGVHIGDQELYANAPNWVENTSGLPATA